MLLSEALSITAERESKWFLTFSFCVLFAWHSLSLTQPATQCHTTILRPAAAHPPPRSSPVTIQEEASERKTPYDAPFPERPLPAPIPHKPACTTKGTVI